MAFIGAPSNVNVKKFYIKIFLGQLAHLIVLSTDPLAKRVFSCETERSEISALCPRN